MKEKHIAPRLPHDADPARLLMEEHEQGIMYLTRLEEAAEYMQTKGFSFDAFRDVAEASRFIDTVLREHDEREEQFLFPRMEGYMNGEIESLRREHRELWREFRTFLECVSDVENMKIHTGTVRDLIHSARAVSELLRSHFTKEDEMLFDVAKRVLTTDEYRQLMKNIAPNKPRESGDVRA